MYKLAKSETRRFDALGYRIYRGAAGRGRLPFARYQETSDRRANDRCKPRTDALAESLRDYVTTKHLIMPLRRRDTAAILPQFRGRSLCAAASSN